MMIRLAAILVLTLSGAAASATDVKSVRCAGKIIDPGLPIGYVIALCGDPVSHVIEEAPVRARGRGGFSYVTGITVTEQLIYDRGWGRFPVWLQFQDGLLRRIQYLPRH